jgi:hypothetical protein
MSSSKAFRLRLDDREAREAVVDRDRAVTTMARLCRLSGSAM